MSHWETSFIATSVVAFFAAGCSGSGSSETGTTNCGQGTVAQGSQCVAAAGSGGSSSGAGGSGGAAVGGGGGAPGGAGGVGGTKGTPPQPGQIPTTVSIASTTVTPGTFVVKNPPQNLPTFSITKSPIRVREYRDCVQAGACSEPKKAPECNEASPGYPDGFGYVQRRTYDLPNGDELPVTCVTQPQAASYCAWVGGRLPKVAEWYLAARGPNVHTYPWGDDMKTNTCDRHPFGDSTLPHTLGCCTVDLVTCDPSLFQLGTHPMGASPTGVEDVNPGTFEAAIGDGSGACNGPFCATDFSDAVPTQIPPFNSFTAEQTTLAFAFRCILNSK